MKSKMLTVCLLGLLLTGCSKVPAMGNGLSFRTQMCELAQLRDAGVMTEKEYYTSKRRIFSTMVH